VGVPLYLEFMGGRDARAQDSIARRACQSVLPISTRDARFSFERILKKIAVLDDVDVNARLLGFQSDTQAWLRQFGSNE
jgi:hypothetical protein